MLASLIFASTTYAANGTCALNARRASGTYGYATEGIATGPNPFVPPGPFPKPGPSP